MNNYCVFILTHNRAKKVITEKTLRKQGYTGDIYYVIDNHDGQTQDYIDLYGDKVIIFSKEEAEKITDEADNFNNLRGVVYARNAIFGIAEKLGYEYFLVLDDDYTRFVHKFDEKGIFGDWKIQSLDKTFSALVDYYSKTKALSLAISQTGDFIGGAKGSFAKVRKPRRKAMNLFVCSTKRPFKFSGRINEDVNAYVSLGNIGGLFLTVVDLCLQQKQTQTNSGGLAELYLDVGTYVKSFYSVIIAPYCVKVTMMGTAHKRLHHKIKWDNAVPKILSEEIKKK